MKIVPETTESHELFSCCLAAVAARAFDGSFVCKSNRRLIKFCNPKCSERERESFVYDAHRKLKIETFALSLHFVCPQRRNLLLHFSCIALSFLQIVLNLRLVAEAKQCRIQCV